MGEKTHLRIECKGSGGRGGQSAAVAQAPVLILDQGRSHSCCLSLPSAPCHFLCSFSPPTPLPHLMQPPLLCLPHPHLSLLHDAAWNTESDSSLTLAAVHGLDCYGGWSCAQCPRLEWSMPPQSKGKGRGEAGEREQRLGGKGEEGQGKQRLRGGVSRGWEGWRTREAEAKGE